MVDGEGMTPATASERSSLLAEDSEVDSSRKSELGDEDDEEGNEFDMDGFGQDSDDATSGSDDETDTSIDSAQQAEILAHERHALLKAALTISQSAQARRESQNDTEMAVCEHQKKPWPAAATLDVLVSWALDIVTFRDAIVQFFQKYETRPLCLDSRDSFELLTPLESTSACSLGTIFKETRVLEEPSILVWCQGSVTSIKPPAISFWDKLGLTPVSGQKQATAFALQVADASEGWAREVRSYFDRMQQAFRSYGLGSHELADDGLLGIGFPGESTISEALASIHNSTGELLRCRLSTFKT